LAIRLIDEDITTSDTTTPSIEVQGPIIRSRVQQLCHQVNSFIYSSANDLDNRLLPNSLIFIRNQGVDHGGHVGCQEGA
jgi:Ni2+-binding GTPase involved in maturation of urease and hydrogenase